MAVLADNTLIEQRERLFQYATLNALERVIINNLELKYLEVYYENVLFVLRDIITVSLRMKTDGAIPISSIRLRPEVVDRINGLMATIGSELRVTQNSPDNAE